MSFLGSIGTYIACSGIEQVLALVYTPNTVNSLLTGKAYTRAIRGHFLLDSTLFYRLISKFGEPRDSEHAFETIMEDSTQFDDINKDGIDNFQSFVSELKDKHSVSRTARYCFQYMDYIQVVIMFIYAERAGD